MPDYGVCWLVFGPHLSDGLVYVSPIVRMEEFLQTPALLGLAFGGVYEVP